MGLQGDDCPVSMLIDKSNIINGSTNWRQAVEETKLDKDYESDERRQGRTVMALSEVVSRCFKAQASMSSQA